MREIKFRAWDKKEKKMYFFANWSLDSEYSYFALGFEHLNWREGVVTKEYTKNCILMQYTGLKDKNGKEIYEGDIVRCSDFVEDAHASNEWIREVEWDNNQPMFLGIEGETNEVIGNLYETPELLEGAK